MTDREEYELFPERYAGDSPPENPIAAAKWAGIECLQGFVEAVENRMADELAAFPGQHYSIRQTYRAYIKAAETLLKEWGQQCDDDEANIREMGERR